MLDAEGRLAALKARGLLRALSPVDGPGVEVRLGDRPVISFCGNDYLGLSRDARLAEAAAVGARRWGVGAGASRLVAGDHPALRALEEELADWLGAEACLVFGSGYHTNVGVLSSLPLAGETVLSDALNHASIIDGCRLGRAAVEVLPHGDTSAARAAFERVGGLGWWVSESVFSMDGDVADLGALLPAARAAGVTTVVDEAHALGVLGPDGRGVAAACGAGRPDVFVGTFGKAFGGFGAFVAGDRALRELLVNVARPGIYSTALPPPAAEAARAALRIVRAEPERRRQLANNVAWLHGALAELGLRAPADQTHILPVVLGTPERAVAASEALLARGLFVRAIRPPTVPAGTSRLRITLSAEHTRAHLDRLVEALAQVLSGTSAPEV